MGDTLVLGGMKSVQLSPVNYSGCGGMVTYRPWIQDRQGGMERGREKRDRAVKEEWRGR